SLIPASAVPRWCSRGEVSCKRTPTPTAMRSVPAPGRRVWPATAPSESSSAWRQRSSRVLAQLLDDLGEDRDRDLAGRARVDGKPDGAVEPVEVGLGEAAAPEPPEARCVRLPAAEAADVEGTRAQPRLERGVVELGIVRQRHDGG